MIKSFALCPVQRKETASSFDSRHIVIAFNLTGQSVTSYFFSVANVTLKENSQGNFNFDVAAMCIIFVVVSRKNWHAE